jgi:protein gp37
MNPTSIAWCLSPDGSPGFTWNPVVGCRPVSPGCNACWASRLASTRLAHLPQYAGLAKDGRWTGEVRFLSERLAEPLRKRKPCGIFVCDMGDLFHESVTDEQIAAAFGVMGACPWHRFYVLTKRARRMREWFGWVDCEVKRRLREAEGTPREGIELEPQDYVAQAALRHRKVRAEVFPVPGAAGRMAWPQRWPLPNVWCGCTVDDQQRAEERIPDLLQTPAAVRFLSVEPLLGPVDLEQLNDGSWYDSEGAQCYDALRGAAYYRDGEHGLAGGPRIDWVVCGAESGPSARLCQVDWIRSIVRQCRVAQVPCFVKQLGANCRARNDENWTGDENDPGFPKWPGHLVGEDRIEHLPGGGYQGAPVRVRFRNRAGADPAEWPVDLRVRELPEVRP